MMVLVIFATDNGQVDGTTLFLLPWEDIYRYAECHGHMLNRWGLPSLPRKLADKIEHLAYMLGLEPYFGAAVPTYEEGMAVMNYDIDTLNSPNFRTKRAPAPWAFRKVHGPLVDFSKVERIINTGWFTT
jgi:hypothetical protein